MKPESKLLGIRDDTGNLGRGIGDDAGDVAAGNWKTMQETAMGIGDGVGDLTDGD